ncbi:ARM repeat-containing protein [Glarea lozoyensis ATCC 20868]|uniref:ARM repeat-containing protein n=1 Tax=Glarea lozoyensis (strain ATCC 20868 / MF5171) TaxID=1116229 RepID=S3DWS7_GLAL2|nr:ARM repeat-containing protein [Glarea lozoyensis ATCC 20868]EPE36396.1 ARM repeat-containing protein [Glarea lozoyensis ATCC 20868]
MDQADIPSLLSRLNSDEDAMRKMAVFKLQSSINDPAFADLFISSGGLTILRRLIMSTGGNTLAYSLQSLTRLLEVDMGWEIFESSGSGELVERVVELIVTHPLVNILRGAMSILVAIVSHSQSDSGASMRTPGAFGFRALKPAVAVFPQFFEMVVSQLNSADHALCANALMLLNALMRDAISSEKDGPKTGGTVEEWPKFIKRLQDLGVIKAVYVLMQSSALQDLAHPLLEFQALTKVLLKKWRDVNVDLERPEHRRALKGIHLASAPEKKDKESTVNGTRTEELAEGGSGNARKGSRKHNPEKWRRLGFETESPAWEFDPTGFLGMMDLTDYVRKEEDNFQKMLLEQSTRPLHERCPIATASLACTAILYEHFEVEKSDVEDAKSYLVLDGMKNYDKIFRPLLLQWSRLHTASLHAFFRLWKSTGAEREDFDKVAELVRILIDQVVGLAPRTKDMLEIEEELSEFEYSRLREMQMELLELSFEDEWGQHLHQVRDELKHEALQFVKEQRIRCLLSGAWFPRTTLKPTIENPRPWRYIKLSHNRRYLHYADFDTQTTQNPTLDALLDKIDLSTISSVISNVSATDESSSISSTSTLKTTSHSHAPPQSTTKITINTTVEGGERAILTLMPATHSLASEWLDGLLMLLNQTPITAETNRLVGLVGEYGLKIRLLNVRMGEGEGYAEGRGVVPSREGLDEDYFYEV